MAELTPEQSQDYLYQIQTQDYRNSVEEHLNTAVEFFQLANGVQDPKTRKTYMLSLGPASGLNEEYILRKLQRKLVAVNGFSAIDANEFFMETLLENPLFSDMQSEIHTGSFGTNLPHLKNKYAMVTCHSATNNLNGTEIQNVLTMLNRAMCKTGCLHFSGLGHEDHKNKDYSLQCHTFHKFIENGPQFIFYTHHRSKYIELLESAGFEPDLNYSKSAKQKALATNLLLAICLHARCAMFKLHYLRL